MKEIHKFITHEDVFLRNDDVYIGLKDYTNYTKADHVGINY